MTKLSISNIAWPTEFDAHIYEYMSINGFVGLEIAPTRIFPQNPYNHKKEAAIFAQNLKSKYGIAISSMQSIWFGRTENIFGDEEDRRGLVAYTMESIDFAVVLGCQNIVFGCPKNRNMPEGISSANAVDFFRQIGRHAAAQNVFISLEPNPVLYGTNFINMTDEAFGFVKDVASPGLRVNVDLGTIIYNGESLKTVADNLPLVGHIHISEPGLEQIQRRELHGDLSLLLKENSYQGYVSIEMKNLEDINIVKNTMDYVAGVFK